MSTLDEIDHAVEVLGKGDLMLMHSTSTYPAIRAELNLRAIATQVSATIFQLDIPDMKLVFQTTMAAVALGACAIERHITLDRAMWGSDQAASVEPGGFIRMVRDIRVIESAFGDGIKNVYASELPVLKKLRRV